MKSTAPIGIIGAGQFGLALSNLAAYNGPVIIYSRRQSMVDQINQTHMYGDIQLDPQITATNDPEEICGQCNVLFQVTSSTQFGKVLRTMRPHLNPNHIIIHGTKGFDLLSNETKENFNYDDLALDKIHVMSEVILRETDVIRVGALCGPNLASEILKGLPTATVVASEFDEVIKAGQRALAGKNFFVFGSHDMKAAELAGALKNVIAIASGLLNGRGLGKNTEAMLIIRGLREMILIGQALGSKSSSFFGTPGLGDLIATATSTNSRNYNLGTRIANGENLDTIQKEGGDLVEGVRTVRIAHQIIQRLKLRAPIITAIYRILFEGKEIEESIFDLMKYPLSPDVDFI